VEKGGERTKTVEEAIKTLKEICCIRCPYGSQDMDSCDIRGCDEREAIKILEQEPCTDAISREEALKEMQNYYDDCAKTSEYTRLGFETAMNVVRELPPVTPEKTTITYKDCSEAMMKMWIDNVITDGQYNKIMDKLNAKHIADMRGVSE